MLTFLICMWSFIKEIFTGDKLDDPYEKDKGRAKKSSPAKIAGVALDKMQKSRPFLAFVALSLCLSLFVNFKTIPKLLAREEETRNTTVVEKPPGKSESSPETVPKPPPDTAGLKDKALGHLHNLYGVRK